MVLAFGGDQYLPATQVLLGAPLRSISRTTIRRTPLLCWEVHPQSPVWDEFASTEEYIRDYLERHHLLPTASGALFSLCYVGRSRSQVKAVVVVHCEDKAVRLMAKEIIGRSPEWRRFQQEHPAFDLMSTAEAPSPRARSIDSGSVTVYASGGADLAIGTDIRFGSTTREGNQTEYGVSRLGPTIFHNGQPYSVSVSHQFLNSSTTVGKSGAPSATEPPNASTVDDHNEDEDPWDISEDGEPNSGSPESDNSASELVDSSSHAETTVLPLPLPSSTRDSMNLVVVDEDSADSETWQKIETQPGLRDPDDKLSSVIGDVSHKSSSHTARQHDWSLIKPNKDLFDQLKQRKRINAFISPGPSRVVKKIVGAAEVPRAYKSACLITSAGQSEHATLSGSRCSYRLPGTIRFLNVHRVYTARALVLGESGTAVVDPDTGLWYGHIIAAQDNSNIAYMLAATDILESISESLGVAKDSFSFAVDPELELHPGSAMATEASYSYEMSRQDPSLTEPSSHEKAISAEETATAPVQPEHSWKDWNLLTFDGGGIRGYWSLLVLRRLMEYISAIEMKNDVQHSFHPLRYPEEVSQFPRTLEEKKWTRIHSSLDGNADITGLDPTRRYLPCHYFDCIGGTSTGGLIALMLGRLRMTTLDALDEYERLSGRISGQSNLMSWSSLLGSRRKYSAANAQQAFVELVERKGEVVNREKTRSNFQSRKWTCQTFVTTLQGAGKSISTAPHIIRSYDDPPSYSSSDRQSQVDTSGSWVKRTVSDPWLSRIREPGSRTTESDRGVRARALDIWQVARAATAAPKFFSPFTVEDPLGGVLTFEDASMHVCNPTMMGIKELEHIRGTANLGVVVSVSTAKADYKQKAVSMGGAVIDVAIRRMVDDSPVDRTHADAANVCRRDDAQYFRFEPSSPEYKLQTGLDEWEPKTATGGKPPGSATLTYMADQFERWFEGDSKLSYQFRQCAKDLVARRQARSADAAKWERYVTGSHFRCQEESCQMQYTFHDEFLRHSRDQPSTHPRAQQLTDEQLLERGRQESWRYPKGELRNGPRSAIGTS